MSWEEIIEWMVGFKEALRKNGQDEAAGVIKEMIGGGGKGGIAKVLSDYTKENPLDLGDIAIPLVVHRGDGTSEEIKVELKFSDNDILDGVIKGVLGGAIITGLLAIGK